MRAKNTTKLPFYGEGFKAGSPKLPYKHINFISPRVFAVNQGCMNTPPLRRNVLDPGPRVLPPAYCELHPGSAGPPGAFGSLAHPLKGLPHEAVSCHLRPGDCLSKNGLQNFRQLVAAGLDDLVVIFNPVILASSEGGLIPATNSVMFPMGIVLQRTSALFPPWGPSAGFPSLLTDPPL